MIIKGNCKDCCHEFFNEFDETQCMRCKFKELDEKIKSAMFEPPKKRSYHWKEFSYVVLLTVPFFTFLGMKFGWEIQSIGFFMFWYGQLFGLIVRFCMRNF